MAKMKGLFSCLRPEDEDQYSSLQISTSSTSSNLSSTSTSSTSSTRPIITSINERVPNLRKHHIYNSGSSMNESSQRELNLLIANPTGPQFNDDGKGIAESKDNGTVIVDGSDTKNRLASINNDTPDTPALSLRELHLGPQVLASISVSLGSMVVGYASGYTSPALESLKTSQDLGVITTQQISWIGSLMPLSALVGGICGGPLIEIIGRRTTILATAVPFIVSWLLIALAVNIPMIYAGRSIAGFCVGVASLCLPVYLGETIQPEVRGMLGLLPTTLGNIGILLCFVAGSYIDWSALAFLGGCLPVPFLILMFLIPETPRWYISKNRNDQARKALQWLRGKDADITNEFNAIEKTHLDAKKYSTGSSFDLFNKSNLKPMAISIGLMFFQQMSGINAVVFYTVSIFKDAGSTIDGNLATIIVGVVNFGATFVATMLIDRLGRKVLLYISGVAMTISLTILGTFFYLKNYDHDVTQFGWLPLVSFVVFVIGFSLGYGPIPWLMMGEILPAKIRGPAASLTTAFNWACTFIVTKTFADLIEAVGQHGTFWIFALFCLVGLFFVFFCVPETQGRSLEDIEQRFAGPRRRMSSIANLKPLHMAG